MNTVPVASALLTCAHMTFLLGHQAPAIWAPFQLFKHSKTGPASKPPQILFPLPGSCSLLRHSGSLSVRVRLLTRRQLRDVSPAMLPALAHIPVPSSPAFITALPEETHPLPYVSPFVLSSLWTQIPLGQGLCCLIHCVFPVPKAWPVHHEPLTST